MTLESRIIKVGDELAVMIPEELTRTLSIVHEVGVQLRLMPDGSILLNFQNDALRKQLLIADSVIRRYPNTLQELAK